VTRRSAWAGGVLALLATSLAAGSRAAQAIDDVLVRGGIVGDAQARTPRPGRSR
jgi:hypothetical protein